MVNRGEGGELSKLLQLKRLEMPSDGEWASFDIAFENRKLSAMGDSLRCKIRSRIASLWPIGGVSWRSVLAVFLFAAIFVGSVAISSLGSGGSSSARRDRGMSTDGRIEFASDSMFASSSGVDIKSGVRSMNCARDGIRYVSDRLLIGDSTLLLAKM
jgi:hypothetical protein